MASHDDYMAAPYVKIIKRLEAERDELLALARRALDALDAEKEPDHERGYDKAVEALLAMFGKRPVQLLGENVPLDKLPPNDALSYDALNEAGGYGATVDDLGSGDGSE